MSDNQELIEKTMSTSNLVTGGRLNTEQQDAFIRFVKDNSVMLNMVRFVEMATSRKQIDKLYIGEPVTSGVAENANTANDSAATFDQIDLLAYKYKSDWQITTELLQENIVGGNFDTVMMDTMGKRISTDVEMAAIQGDSSITATTRTGKLLKVQDGWDILTDGAQILDAQGDTISPAIFIEAQRRMPEEYLQDPNLRWFVPRSLMLDWQETVSSRLTAAGDAALGGSALNPYGIPVTVVPNIPSRKSVSSDEATPAEVVSTGFRPFTITTGTNDKLTINVNAGGNVALTLAGGVYTATELISEIRAKLVAAGATGIAANNALIMQDNGQGQILFRTAAVGSSASIQIVAVSGDCYSEVGLTAATTTGAASGSGSTYDGSFIWLANPQNFIVGMVDDTRIYNEFNKDYDRWEYVVYNQIAFQVENLEAIVKVKNIRRVTNNR